ncbi:MAG TPA: AAA family ATPase [Ktedonobacteraceae bacterium]|jgi:AAA15 family ATPase/GTPase
MSRLLSIILAIATAKNGVVLIDEVDTGIHHSRMPKIWEGICKAARAFNCQVFATTHSYECLQAAHIGIAQANMDRDFRYIRLDRHEQETVAKTYTYEVLGAALARRWEVR